MGEWCETTTCRPFFRPPVTAAQERLQIQFLAAVARSLSKEAAELQIDGSEWRLELLSGDGHLCPVVGVESHQGFLRPVGVVGWSAHEVHCIVDWTCNQWCRQRSERNTTDTQMILSGQRDPSTTCGFRVYFASLQGRFGLPAVRRGCRQSLCTAAQA